MRKEAKANAKRKQDLDRDELLFGSKDGRKLAAR